MEMICDNGIDVQGIMALMDKLELQRRRTRQLGRGRLHSQDDDPMGPFIIFKPYDDEEAIIEGQLTFSRALNCLTPAMAFSWKPYCAMAGPRLQEWSWSGRVDDRRKKGREAVRCKDPLAGMSGTRPTSKPSKVEAKNPLQDAEANLPLNRFELLADRTR